ncbi:hypothetical protein C2S51_011776 [Perilla frutescens var. frutescens]|nr:hypothetical protein C2S51_011776 [Perilla frutescens var. frutescens]
MGIIGSGLIGGTLLDQIKNQATALKEKFNIDLCLMDNTGSRNMLLSDMQVRHLTQGQYQYTQNGTLIDIL